MRTGGRDFRAHTRQFPLGLVERFLRLLDRAFRLVPVEGRRVWAGRSFSLDAFRSAAGSARDVAFARLTEQGLQALGSCG